MALVGSVMDTARKCFSQYVLSGLLGRFSTVDLEAGDVEAGDVDAGNFDAGNFDAGDLRAGG